MQNNNLNPVMRNTGDENKCIFMTLPKCMRQDHTKKLDMSICQACASGRIEGHLFALREELKQFMETISSRR